MARRGISDPAFDLVAATALFRLDDLVAADTIAARLTGSRTPGLADAAWFLRGLIADRQGNRSGLATAAASLSEVADAGDAAELRARLSHDRAVALHAADLRRDILDYRGMARCLALAAQYTADASSAADLYVRRPQCRGARRYAAGPGLAGRGTGAGA